jgi:hypothetical protein
MNLNRTNAESAFERYEWEELAAEERRRNPKLTKAQSFAKAYMRIAALRSARCCAACTGDGVR